MITGEQPSESAKRAIGPRLVLRVLCALTIVACLAAMVALPEEDMILLSLGLIVGALGLLLTWVMRLPDARAVSKEASQSLLEANAGGNDKLPEERPDSSASPAQATDTSPQACPEPRSEPVGAAWPEALTALHRIDLSVASGLQGDKLWTMAQQALSRVVPFESFALVFGTRKKEGLTPALLMKGRKRLEGLEDGARMMSSWGHLMQRVISASKPLVIDDWLRDATAAGWKPEESPRQQSLPVGSDVGPRQDERMGGRGSWIGVPLPSSDGPLGVMAVHSGQEKAFDASHQQLLEAVAASLSVAAQREKWEEEDVSRRRHLTALRQIGEMMASELDLERTLNLIVKYVSQVFPVEAALLFLNEADGINLRAVTGTRSGSLKPAQFELGEGIAGWAIEHRQAVLLPDVRSDPRYARQAEKETGLEASSLMCVPIEHEDRVIGMLEVINPLSRRPFTEDDLAALNNIAASVGVAIENAQLHRETKQRLKEVSTLYDLAGQVATSLDLNEVLEAIVKRFREIFQCRAACIFLLNEDTGFLEIRASSGIAAQWIKEARMKPGEGVAGKVVSTGLPTYVRDTLRDADFIIFDQRVRSLLVVPLIIQGRVIGTLSVDDHVPDAFSERDTQLLTIAAAQAAVAIDNARLYEGLKDRAKSLEQAYEAMKEVNRLKTELVQNISHELRTPLTFIKGYVELLLDGTLGQLQPKQGDALRIISERTAIVVRLVSDIITLQKTEMGQFSFFPCHVEAVICQAIEGARASADRAGTVLCQDIPDHLPLVMADHDRILQVFDNLLTNAIKFSPDGGTITVRSEAQPGHVLVEVEDHGIGIPEDKIEKVFERFYQVDGSMTRRFGGTGLGLAIVKQIVEAHGGRVWVKSKLNEGSTFFFTLPSVSQEQIAKFAGLQLVNEVQGGNA